MVIGVVGGAVGVGLGFAGAALVTASPAADGVGRPTTGGATPGGARLRRRRRSGGGGGGVRRRRRRRSPARTQPLVAVHLTPRSRVEPSSLAVVLAIAGGLIAGTFGGWRAARLRPAAALAGSSSPAPSER